MNKECELIPTGTIIARGRDLHGDECVSAVITMTVAAWESIIDARSYLGMRPVAQLQPSQPLDARIAYLLVEEEGTCEANLEDARAWLAENGDEPSRDRPRP